MIHRVVVYLRPPQVIAHVQSTNSEDWPRLIHEWDKNGVELPLTRIELEVEATQEEIDAGENGRPRHRKASVLFREELEYDIPSGKVRYRVGQGGGGAINPHIPVALPV